MTENKILTYVDANILIAAVRGRDDIHQRAMKILDDPNREFTASEFLRLEVLPKPLFNKLNDEAEFYEAFFETIEKWASNFQDIVKDAYKYAVRHGLSALDALHVASALTVGADEFVTGEKPTKPINSVSALKIHSIHSE
ncbi:MAG: PIN domain protein [Candidatus Brocadia sinica]|nr:MAG: PIN domain protein [Candidatus Brocadia sinica]